jgi:hypothetical protein
MKDNIQLSSLYFILDNSVAKLYSKDVNKSVSRKYSFIQSCVVVKVTCVPCLLLSNIFINETD